MFKEFFFFIYSKEVKTMAYKNWEKHFDRKEKVTYFSKEEVMETEPREYDKRGSHRLVIVTAEKKDGKWYVRAEDYDRKPMSGWAKVQQRTEATQYVISKNSETQLGNLSGYTSKKELISDLSDFLENHHPDELTTEWKT